MSVRSEEDKFLMVEVVPPLDGDLSNLIKLANSLKELDVTSITFADCPGGMACVDSILTAIKIKEETGMDVIPHVSCRDRNIISLRAQLLGAHANGIRNMLFVTGDPVPSGKRETIKSVFNCNSTALMEMAAGLNRLELQKTPIRYGGCVNYNKRDIDDEIKKVKAKMDNGALFFFSQPVYTHEDADVVRTIAIESKANIYCAIRPLVSKKNASYMKNSVVGINVPQSLVDGFSSEMTKEEGEAFGLLNAREMLNYIKDFTYGYSFSFPFNRTYLLEKLLADLD